MVVTIVLLLDPGLGQAQLVEIKHQEAPAGWKLFVSPAKYMCHLFDLELHAQVTRAVDQVRKIPELSGITQVVFKRPVGEQWGNWLDFDRAKDRLARYPWTENLHDFRNTSQWTTVARLMRYPRESEDATSIEYDIGFSVEFRLKGDVDPVTLERKSGKSKQKEFLCKVAIPTGKRVVEQYRQYVCSRIGDPQYNLASDPDHRLIYYPPYERRIKGQWDSTFPGSLGYHDPKEPMDVVRQHMARYWYSYALEEIPMLLHALNESLQGGIYLGEVEPQLVRLEYHPTEATNRGSALVPVYVARQIKGGMGAKDGMRFDGILCDVNGTEVAWRASGPRRRWFWGKVNEQQEHEAYVSQAYCTLLVDLWKIDKDDNLQRVFEVRSGDLASMMVTKEQLIKLCGEEGVHVPQD